MGLDKCGTMTSNFLSSPHVNLAPFLNFFFFSKLPCGLLVISIVWLSKG